MRIFYSPEFERRYRMLSLEMQKKAEAKEKIFCKDPFDPRLKTHKLHGRLGEFWSFSLDHTHHIIFMFIEEGDVRFYAIGDHSV